MEMTGDVVAIPVDSRAVYYFKFVIRGESHDMVYISLDADHSKFVVT